MSKPTDAIDLFPEAQRLASLRQYDKALEILHKLITLMPDHLDAILTIGQIQTHLGKYGDAIETFRKAESLAPDDKRVADSLANVLPHVVEKKDIKRIDNEFTRRIENSRREQKDKRVIDLNAVLKYYQEVHGSDAQTNGDVNFISFCNRQHD